jgi:prevent-host-death family protein
MSRSAEPPKAQLEADESSGGLLPITELRKCLQEVMPIALVRASKEAAERVVAVSEIDELGPDGVAVKSIAVDYTYQLAAALGVIAPATTAAAVGNLLGKSLRSRFAFLPRWLRPRIDPDRAPRLATMTEFSQDRSRLVREVIEESTPVLISRHGRIVAALVPLEPGAFEETVYKAAGRARAAIEEDRSSPELDDSLAERILSAGDPAVEAAALGVDTSDWASLNPQD